MTKDKKCMDDILNVKVAQSPKRKVKITKVEKKEVSTLSGVKLEKVLFETFEPATGKSFTISDAWVEDTGGLKKVKGLWFSLVDGELHKGSTLARMMDYYECKVIGDLVGQIVTAYPDKNDYVVFTSCDME